MPALPRYHQIFLLLREAIRDGVYAADQQVPGEMELAAQYGVSRITTKRALNELERAGLVTRERGRGTRVRRSAVEAVSYTHLTLPTSDLV